MSEDETCSELSTVINNNSTTKGLEGQHELAWLISFTSGAVVLSLAIVIGNISILLCMWKNSQFSSNFKTYTSFLAFADMAVGLITIPFGTTNVISQNWPFGNTVCIIGLILDNWLPYVSVLLLDAIAYDRYKCVTTPLLYRTQFTKRRAVKISVALFILSFLFWAALILGQVFSTGLRTILVNDKCSLLQEFALITLPSVAHCVPVIFLVSAYGALLLSLKKRMQGGQSRKETAKSADDAKLTNDTNSMKPVPTGIVERRITVTDDTICPRDDATEIQPGETLQPNERFEIFLTDVDVNLSRTVPICVGISGKRRPIGLSHIRSQNQQCLKTTSAVIIVCLLCWVPYCITWPLYQLYPGCISRDVYYATHVPVIINSAINPFIHILTNPTIRSRIVGFVCRR